MRLERFTGNVAVALCGVCVTVLALTVVALARPDLRAAVGLGSLKQRPAFVIGQPVGGSPALYSAAPRTLLVFLQADCASCKRAQPMLKAFLERGDLADRAVRIVMDVASDADRAKSLDYVRSLGADESLLSDVDIRSTSAKLVPSVVLVDQRGIVLSFREPPLSADTLQRVLMFERPPLH